MVSVCLMNFKDVFSKMLVKLLIYNGHLLVAELIEKLIIMKLYRFELLFFGGTVITGKFCVGVPLNIQSIYLSIYACCRGSSSGTHLNITCDRCIRINERNLGFYRNVSSHCIILCLVHYHYNMLCLIYYFF